MADYINLTIEVDGTPLAEIPNIEVRALRKESEEFSGIAGVLIHAIDAATETRMWYVHKYEIWKDKGGAEEGGWWYTQGEPVDDWDVIPMPTEDLASEQCRILNDQERMRREGLKYGPDSAVHELGQPAPEGEDPADTAEYVAAYQRSGIADEHVYTYTVETTSSPTEYPVDRPHYE